MGGGGGREQTHRPSRTPELADAARQGTGDGGDGAEKAKQGAENRKQQDKASPNGFTLG